MSLVGELVRIKETHSLAYAGLLGTIVTVDDTKGLPFGISINSKEGTKVLRYFYREEFDIEE